MIFALCTLRYSEVWEFASFTSFFLSSGLRKDIGYGEELWTYRSLQKHIRKHCMDAGYPGLSQISPNTVRTILESGEIKPNKITYYLERKDQITTFVGITYQRNDLPCKEV